MRAAESPCARPVAIIARASGPQAQAPTGAPRHPRVGSPMIRWPQGAPAPTAPPDLTAMRGLDGGNGAGGGTHARIVQPPARGPDRHAPGPGGPGPPGPGRPGLEHRPPAPGGRQSASAHGPHRQSHARPPSPPLHRRARHAPAPGPPAHADQPSAISSIARRRTSPGDPHTTRHIDHSSEPVMVQPSPDTAPVLVRKAQCAYVCSRSIARARENWTSTVRFIDTG